MAKGYQANKDRQDELNSFGKSIGKRAGFKCEWCESKEDLRIWDAHPEAEMGMENLALLCQRCRGWALGAKPDQKELRAIRNALWSDVPAIAEGAARVLAQCKESWVREAIEESYIDEALKMEILK